MIARNRGDGSYYGKSDFNRYHRFTNNSRYRNNLSNHLNNLDKKDMEWLMKQKREVLDWMIKMGKDKCNVMADKHKADLRAKAQFNMPKLSSYNKDKSVLNKSRNDNQTDTDTTRNESRDNANTSEKSIFDFSKLISEMKNVTDMMKTSDSVYDTCINNNNLSSQSDGSGGTAPNGTTSGGTAPGGGGSDGP